MENGLLQVVVGVGNPLAGSLINRVGEKDLMKERFRYRLYNRMLGLVIVGLLSAGCSSMPELKSSSFAEDESFYLIGPGDTLNIFVWGNQEVSGAVKVRPDGLITTPLVEDLVASGKTPTRLARDMEKQLAKYIKSPVVTVTVADFVGRPSEQIRIVGEAAKPMAIPYREQITLLDVMISVGGLTEYAAGNSATIVRVANGKRRQYRVRLDDLIKDGDITANVNMRPGDILIIPESMF